MRRKQFQALVETYGGVAYRLACRLTQDPHLAEDIVQAGCVKAYQGYDPARLRDETHVRNWFLRVVYTAAMDHFRRSQHEHSTESLDEVDEEKRANPEPATDRTTQDPSYAAEMRELRTLIREEMDKLPEPQRVALALHAVDGLTYEAIAEVVGCPVGTVMSRIYYARRTLRQRLGRYDPLLLSSQAVSLRGGGAKGKVVLVGGGSGGKGRETVERRKSSYEM